MDQIALRRLTPLAVATALVLSGCGALSGEGSVDDKTVTAAFYPLAYASQRVAGEHLTVENLISAGGEPHDLQLSIRQTGQVAGAGLVVYESGFQPAVDEAVKQNAKGATLDAADVIDLREIGEDTEAHESHDDEHGHGDHDPHFWLDPLLMADLADALATKLGAIDPDHAEDFTANAEDFRGDLEQLDRAYAEGLASCERDTVLVNHEAFGYLSRYGLQFEAITGLSPGAEPTPGDRARLERLIRAKGITTVFSEELGSKQAARSLARDLKVRAAVLDPIEGLSDQTSGENYLSLMEENLTALKRANGC